MDELLSSVVALREETQAKVDALYKTVTDEKRAALTDEEAAQYDALKVDRDALDARIVELRKEQEAREAVKAMRATVGETSNATVKEPATYRKAGEASYFRDLFRATSYGDTTAAERLRRNDAEVRAITTVDGVAGEFVPPLWVISDYVALARPQRIIANEVTSVALPGGTDTISLPKVSTGTSTAEQSTQNSTLSNTDIATTSVSASVATLGGIQIMSVQLLEQSPINMDEVILQDLTADLAQRIDTFVISNNASGKYGLLSVSGIQTSTYTSASPTAYGLYSKIADAVQKVHTNRYAPATKIFMHPRRWAFMLAAVDGQNRPLVVPTAGGPFNVLGNQEGVVAAGYAGTLQGLPVYLDANIPTNLGAGTNEDRIIVVKHDDIRLYESAPKAEVFRETKADQGSVLVRLYEYVALHSARYPASIAVISGTGLVTPSF
jgi:HK97 family phage major capsid protein